MRTTESEARQPHSESALRFAPLGIPAAIIADDSALLDAAIANFADLRDDTDADPRIVIRLRRNELATANVGFAVSVKGSCLTIEGQGVGGHADAATGRAECRFSSGYRHDSRILPEIGETLLLFLLTRSGRVPVHAACIVIGETAILLAGRSGCGKSSLALAAQRQGLPVLSEDTTYVELEQRLRIRGWPGAIHLNLADAPEGEFPQRRRGGRTKAAVSRIPAMPFAERAVLVAIEPGRKLELERVEADRLLAQLPAAEPGFDLLAPQVEKAMAAVAEGGAWRLTLNDSPGDAVSLLREQFGRAITDM